MKKKKKASMSSTTIVTLILLLVGFVLVLFFYSQLKWTGNVDREVCHQSVILRATAAQIPGAKNLIPLTCKTEKICVGKECKSLENVKGITKAKLDTQIQIEKLISQEMLDCWTMMGEGKVSLFSSGVAESYGLGEVYPTCVICSRISFDEDLDLKEGELTDVDPFRYMVTHKLPGKEISYYEAFSGQKGKFSVDEDLYKKELGEIEKKLEEKLNKIDFDKFKEGLELNLDEVCNDLDEDAKKECEKNMNELLNKYEEVSSEQKDIGILFMQISTTGHFDATKNLVLTTAVAGTAGHFISFGATTKAISKVSRLVPPWVKLLTAFALVAGQQGMVLHNKGVTAGYCGDISVGQEAREGCSVVRTIPYDLENLKKYCSVIESIP